MNITYVGRKVNLKDSFKERAEKKLRKLERFFGNEAFIKITVTVEKDRQTVEITVKYKGFYFRSESTAAEMETALDLAIETLTRQIVKNKSKLEKRVYTSAFTLTEEETNIEEDEIKIVKTKTFPIKPMDPEEAVLQMNMLNHNFFIFTNRDTGMVNVVYRRKDGKFGLLEPESN